MRILVYGAAGEVYGGIESFLLNMNKFMSEDCIFDYVIVGNRCIYADQIEAKGGQVYFVTSYKKNPLRFLMDSWRIAKAARKSHKTAYFNLFSMCHITSVIICRLWKYHIVLHSHNNGIPNKSSLYHMIHQFGRWLLSGMKCTRLTNSDASAVFMFGKKYSGNRKVKLVYNAIDTGRFRFSPAIRKRLRQELRLEDHFVVGFAGRLSAQKNPIFLMEIFEQIHIQNPQALFLVAGDGAYRKAMEEKARNGGFDQCVRFLGHRTDMDALYQAMDCFLLPSLFEGLGIVLVEAQAAGLHCFASAEVIPPIVQLSEDVFHFVPLSKSAYYWAEQILTQGTVPLEREKWNDIVATSPFYIEKEAKRLEGVLCS